MIKWCNITVKICAFQRTFLCLLLVYTGRYQYIYISYLFIFFRIYFFFDGVQCVRCRLWVCHVRVGRAVCIVIIINMLRVYDVYMYYLCTYNVIHTFMRKIDVDVNGTCVGCAAAKGEGDRGFWGDGVQERRRAAKGSRGERVVRDGISIMSTRTKRRSSVYNNIERVACACASPCSGHARARSGEREDRIIVSLPPPRPAHETIGLWSSHAYGNHWRHDAPARGGRFE